MGRKAGRGMAAALTLRPGARAGQRESTQLWPKLNRPGKLFRDFSRIVQSIISWPMALPRQAVSSRGRGAALYAFDEPRGDGCFWGVRPRRQDGA